jgi:signal transduction histidine kinase
MRFSQTLGANLLYVAVPVASGGTVHGAVRLTYPTAAVDRRVRSAWAALALVGVVVLGAVGLAGFALARWVTLPVRALEDVTGRLASGDLGAQAAVGDGPPEVRRLAEAFNEMASRLAGLLDAQRAFVTDASHELRTPLTALRLRLENLQDELAPQAQAELTGVIAEADRLSGMVDQLLALARAEAAPTRLASVDLGAVAAGRAAAVGAVAAGAGVRIVTRIEPAGPVLAVAGAAEQVVDNLLANAIRVTPRGGSVELSVRHPAAGLVELHVVDQGPGLSPEERLRAFDRFWRAPASRPGEGSGLGLAIVRQLVAASRGQAELLSAAGGGVDAVVRWRAAPGRPPAGAVPAPVGRPGDAAGSAT